MTKLKNLFAVSIVLFVLAFIGTLSIYLVWPPDMPDLLTNFATEIAGIIVTIVLVDRIITRRLSDLSHLAKRESFLASLRVLSERILVRLIEILNISPNKDPDRSVIFEAFNSLGSRQLDLLADDITRFHGMLEKWGRQYEDMLGDHYADFYWLVRLMETTETSIRKISFLIGERDSSHLEKISDAIDDERLLNTAISDLRDIIRISNKLRDALPVERPGVFPPRRPRFRRA